MVLIDTGEYQRGSPESDEEYYETERPRHLVSLKRPFAIGKYEVTFEEFDKFAFDTGQRPPGDSGFGGDRRPVINISWHDAVAYAKWLSEKTDRHYRLPSEAEWEFAARAGTSTRRFWGDAPASACDYANVYDRGSEVLMPRARTRRKPHDCEDGYKTTAPVGRFKANQLELHDMLGNVGEWVQDCWHDNYEGTPKDASSWLDSVCGGRVVRGGSWNDAPRNVRSAYRNWYSPDDRYGFVGFRLAQDID
jgi:formylglycine-generating enzyme required for sulfatase activity